MFYYKFLTLVYWRSFGQIVIKLISNLTMAPILTWMPNNLMNNIQERISAHFCFLVIWTSLSLANLSKVILKTSASSLSLPSKGVSGSTSYLGCIMKLCLIKNPLWLPFQQGNMELLELPQLSTSETHIL